MQGWISVKQKKTWHRPTVLEICKLCQASQFGTLTTTLDVSRPLLLLLSYNVCRSYRGGSLVSMEHFQLAQL